MDVYRTGLGENPREFTLYLAAWLNYSFRNLLNQVVLIIENPNSHPMHTENHFSTYTVATAGEALIDMVGRPDGSFMPCLGGAVYNLTRALALQDIATLYLNPLSSDRFGRQLAQGLRDCGVGFARPDAVAQPTSLAMVALSESGHPDYAFYREGVADRAIDAPNLAQRCAAATGLQVVCTGALALDPRDAPVYLPWLDAQRQAGRTVVVDANLRPSVMPDLAAYRQHVHAVLQRAHVIKVSDEDLAHLGLAAGSPLEQARQLLEGSHANWLALTCGAEGAHLLTRAGERFSAREMRPLKVVDTVGAGDCFLAGLVARWLGLGLPQAWGCTAVDARDVQCLLDHAIASASLNVQRQGCQPPRAHEIEDWLAGR